MLQIIAVEDWLHIFTTVAFGLEANDANKGFKGRVRHKHGTSWPLYASATPATTNTWTMIEITFDRTNNDFYSWRNGTILDNALTQNHGFVDDGEFRLMRGNNSRNLAGDLAEIIVFQSVNYFSERKNGRLSRTQMGFGKQPSCKSLIQI